MNPARVAAKEILSSSAGHSDTGCEDIIKSAYSPFVEAVREFKDMVYCVGISEDDFDPPIDTFEKLENFLKDMK